LTACALSAVAIGYAAARRHLHSDFEQGEIGPDRFVAACRMGLEGLVSKHCDRPYCDGRSKHWIKVKNRKHPAIKRVMDLKPKDGISRGTK